MGILLIDSSSRITEFGYIENNKILFEKKSGLNSKADSLIYDIKTSFEEAGVNCRETETVAVSNGPGSFTGLRIGSSAAKGMCFSLGCRLVTINTLDITANKIRTSDIITSMIFSNPRIPEFFYCDYKYELNILKRISGYKTGSINEVVRNRDSIYLLNEKITDNIPSEYTELINDVSDKSSIISLWELTKEAMSANNFADYRLSEPYYMKDFVPKI
ncbi:MAG: tRNA (adenosine(37)-N6)-threonylcarbamoyltransferase complex dimerization subunit type 1 TsaB [Ignavibacteria bacterium]|nr:tRNA (adenosine(37)-N6)-threonylcarbamoyltransferase complex dimerization subunit type 1 TsaB [Ignavibacteria bacterium]